MRKLAFAFILCLGFAGASLAAETSNKDIPSSKAPRHCVEFDAGCGTELLCGSSGDAVTLLIIEHLYWCNQKTPGPWAP